MSTVDLFVYCLLLFQVCLQAKDYLNQRYLLKRAIYLSQVAVRLVKSDLVDSVSFAYHHDNYMRPVLVVKPAGTCKTKN